MNTVLVRDMTVEIMETHLTSLHVEILTNTICSTHQCRKADWGKCSHTGTKMHTHVLIQSDLDLSLTLHHHPRQQHWNLTLNKALSETSEQGLVQRQPGKYKKKHTTLHLCSTFSSKNPPA